MDSMDGRSGFDDPVEEVLNTICGGRILDVATGSGGFLTFLLDNIRDFTEITGIDLNQHSLDAARKAFVRDNIHFLQMDASRMEFPDDHFDTVCIANSLHHMADLPGVLSEMRRVCKPGGQFIISEMYRDGQTDTQQTHVALHHWWAAVDTAEGILHHETYTRIDIVAITERMGLKSQESYDLKDLETNPKDPELIQELDGIIDRYSERAMRLDGGPELQQRGEALRQRLHQVGLHGATSLFVIGKK
jgi:ubiquinone/menaquinone biosynthesis C-methylase UbiE